MSAPTVSVLVANYNHGEFLPEALQGILAQTRPPDEVIVVDDGSTDDSLAIARKIASENPLIRIEANERNIGALATIHRLTQMATKEWCLFAAADDVVHPSLIQRAVALVERHPEAGFCSGLSRLIAIDGTDLGLYPSPVVAAQARYFTPAEATELLPRDNGWFVMGNATLWRRDAVAAAGGFRAELGPFTDNFLSMVLALRHGACFIPEALASWRLMDTGLSASAAADPVKTQAVEAAAVRLMTTEFADDFPPGYADEWVRWQAANRELAELRAQRGGGAAAALADAYAEMRAAHRRGLPVSRIARRRLRSLASRRARSQALWT